MTPEFSPFKDSRFFGSGRPFTRGGGVFFDAVRLRGGGTALCVEE